MPPAPTVTAFVFVRAPTPVNAFAPTANVPALPKVLPSLVRAPTTVNVPPALFAIAPFTCPAAFTAAEFVSPPLITLVAVFVSSVPPLTFTPPLIVPAFVAVPAVFDNPPFSTPPALLFSVPLFVTRPPTVPEFVKVALFVTAPAREPLRFSVPPETVVSPVNVLVPDSVRVWAPVLLSVPAPVIAPA